MKIDEINLNSFLDFGYFINYKSRYSINFDLIDKKKYEDCKKDELIKIGANLLRNAVTKQFNSHQKNCIPISGGLDSRLILSVLLKCTEASNISTYTFGIPDTYDYEIGNKIGKTLGTKHYTFNLDNLKYNMEELIQIAKRFDCQTILFLHPRISELDNLFGDHIIWSGAIIDVLFGRHFHPKTSTNLTYSKKIFIKENIYLKKRLSKISLSEYYPYIEFESYLDYGLQNEHILDLLNRQLKYIAPQVLYKDQKFNVLINDEELVSFCLSIDQNLHKKQKLYKEILLKEFPELLNFGYKGNYGLGLDLTKFDRLRKIYNKGINRISTLLLNKTDKMTNYYNFSEKLAKDYNFSLMIDKCLFDIEKRNILCEINIKKIRNNKSKYPSETLLLSSLELNLKAKEEYGNTD